MVNGRAGDHSLAEGSTGMFSVMQGRLSPPVGDRIQCFPRDTWEDEIILAAQAGVASIEWIYDTFGEGANPIETDNGLARMRALAKRQQIVVESLCADWFMDEPLIGRTEHQRRAAQDRLVWLLGRARLLQLKWIVLPFVDNAALTTPDHVDQAVAALEGVLPLARRYGIALHLETSLAPAPFADLLDRVRDPLVGVNYDTGNSSALGFDPVEEFAAYGHRLGSVHIKDRQLGAGTVALGTGDTDFSAVFSQLDRLDYRGPYVLQVARGIPGDERAHIQHAAAFVRLMLNPLFQGAPQ